VSGESDLFHKWIDGTLTREDIQKEVYRLADNVSIGLPHEYKKLNTMLSEADLQHIGYCLHHIYLWWRDGDPVGSFLGPFIKNDLTRTFQNADTINWLGLGIYVEYLHWHAPQSWRTKQRKDYEKEN
jgi:hypothetical protein